MDKQLEKEVYEMGVNAYKSGIKALIHDKVFWERFNVELSFGYDDPEFSKKHNVVIQLMDLWIKGWTAEHHKDTMIDWKTF
ncbi:MAG: hypothetical protein HPY53_12435 [Brevinematales bacterium]|nr:hypothetical protein [Brevinematales bacterium]